MSKFETTAAFAANNQSPKKNEWVPSSSNVNQNVFNNIVASESNKIKEMINQWDNKKSLQEQITKRMDLKSNQTNKNSESPISNGPVIGDSKLGELSEIVKKLLEEQRELKLKLNERDNIIADLSKDKESNRKFTQDKERRTRSLKPPINNSK